MKNLFIILLVLMSLVSFSSWGETMDDLVQREGVYYKKFSDVPFTGKTTGEKQGSFMNGLREGLWISYYTTGELDSKGNYKNGKRTGLWVLYHRNGQLWYKGKYKNGEYEGSWLSYYNDGQVMQKGEFHSNKREGLWVTYHGNGQLNGKLQSKGDYKNGNRVGVWDEFENKVTVLDLIERAGREKPRDKEFLKK